MQKALLHSILLATLILPTLASRARDRQRGLKRMVRWMAIYTALYVLALMFIYPRLGGQ